MILWINYQNAIQRARLEYVDSEDCVYKMALMSTLQPVTVEPRHVCGVEVASDFNIMFEFDVTMQQSDTMGKSGVFWVRRGGLDRFNQRVLILREDSKDPNVVKVRKFQDRNVVDAHVGEFGGVELNEQIIIFFKNATRREA